jgi:predicted PurR-regulated permease PerM
VAKNFSRRKFVTSYPAIPNEESARAKRSLGSSTEKLPSLIAVATFVLIIASLYWAQAVLIPIALAIMLTFLLSPVASASERIGLGRLPSVILIVVLTFSLLGGIGWVVTLQFGSLANELPKYTTNITQKIADVRGAGKGGAFEKVQKIVEEVKSKIQKGHEPTKAGEQGRPVVVQAEESFAFWPVPLAVGPTVERFASAGLVIVLVIFMLIYREDLRNRLIRLIGYGRLTVTTRALEEAGQRISRYLLMQTIINSSFGLAIGFAFYLIGLPYAVLWGFLAAVLRFIPYVGPFAAAIMPSALSLAVFQGWMWPIMVVGLFLVLELVNNMVLEPLLYGESAGVSKVGLLVAIAFWTWLWGPVGLVLATPLTVCVVVLGKYVPGMDFIGVLMSDEPVMESNISYYQRLLAMDQAEAAEIVEEHLKTHPQEQLFDAVLIPALNYARRDRALGRLTEDGEQFVFRATREILEDLNSLKPQSSSEVSDSSKTTTTDGNFPVILPKVPILGCPAQDEADELALLMFRQLLDCTKYEVEIMSAAMLTAGVVARIGEKSPAMICIAAVPPGGLAQTRYLCKRLRARFPDLKIAVGRWGTGSEDSNSILLAGADKVGTTMIETRAQIVQLIQISPDSEGHSGATLAPRHLSPRFFPERK